MRPISSRTESTVIWRDFPEGRTCRQSGWRSGGEGEGRGGAAAEQPVGQGHGGVRKAPGVVARQEQAVRKPAAADGPLNDGHGRCARQGGRPGDRGGRHPVIRDLTASQMLFSVAASLFLPSTTTNRPGMPLASTRYPSRILL